MAVVVQELIVGSASGVAFGEAPDDSRHAVVESVHGLNEGLVDGSIEPDRWILSRASGSVLRHDPASRKRRVAATSAGVRFEPLSGEEAAAPPLRPDQLARVFNLVRRLEALFGAPQDVEWTFAGARLLVLQSRPITARQGESPVDQSVDGRSWSSSLGKSLDYLAPLRQRVETELMPAMRDEVRALGKRDLRSLADGELAAEIRRRADVLGRWESTYAEELIPLAHAIRLFGLFYNETVRPVDPYEFLALLAATPMEGLRRNRMLEEMASQVRGDPALAHTLRNPSETGSTLPESFAQRLDAFLEDFGDLAWGEERCFADRQAVTRHVLQLAGKPSASYAKPATDPATLGSQLLSQLQGGERDTAAELLDLARASYRLRDDDNIALGGIRSRVLEAAEEGRRRLSGRPWAAQVLPSPEEVAQALLDPSFEPTPAPRKSDAGPEGTGRSFRIRARQIVGQPAGPGVATGKARVVTARSDLLDFSSGEVLVCDAIEPNMTFIVPLAAAVVERRGGMLIHGAIIAREYGLPCVTGIPEATALIHTGDTVTVDGHLGIVIVE
jgi:pyruvate,water dikinase